MVKNAGLELDYEAAFFAKVAGQLIWKESMNGVMF